MWRDTQNNYWKDSGFGVIWVLGLILSTFIVGMYPKSVVLPNRIEGGDVRGDVFV